MAVKMHSVSIVDASTTAYWAAVYPPEALARVIVHQLDVLLPYGIVEQGCHQDIMSSVNYRHRTSILKPLRTSRLYSTVRLIVFACCQGHYPALQSSRPFSGFYQIFPKVRRVCGCYCQGTLESVGDQIKQTFHVLDAQQPFHAGSSSGKCG